MVTKKVRIIIQLLACFRLCEDTFVLEQAQCQTEQCQISAAVMQDMCHENCTQLNSNDILRELERRRKHED